MQALRNSISTQTFDLPKKTPYFPANGKKEKVTNVFIKAHNAIIDSLDVNSQVVDLNNSTIYCSIPKKHALKKFGTACAMQEQVASDPVNFIKGHYGHTKSQRAVSLVISGPLIGVAETVTNFLLFLFEVGRSIVNGIELGIAKIQKNDIKLLEKKIAARSAILEGFAYLFKAACSVPRIVPIVGPFLSYSGKIVSNLDFSKLIASLKTVKIEG